MIHHNLVTNFQRLENSRDYIVIDNWHCHKATWLAMFLENNVRPHAALWSSGMKQALRTKLWYKATDKNYNWKEGILGNLEFNSALSPWKYIKLTSPLAFMMRDSVYSGTGKTLDGEPAESAASKMIHCLWIYTGENCFHFLAKSAI